MAEPGRGDEVTVGRAGAMVLIGFMGSGKTTLARSLDPEAVDADREIERRAGRSIAEIFAAEGEAGFRRLEESVVLELLAEGSAAAPKRSVIALGGGAVESEAVRAALSAHLVVWLEVSAETAWRRVQGGGERPLARDRDRFFALHAARAPVYAGLADAVLGESAGAGPRGGATGRAIAAALERLAALPAGTRMLWAESGSGSYPAYVGPGVIGPRGFGPELWPLPGRRFFVTDATVESLARPRFGAESASDAPGPAERDAAAAEIWHVLPPGEQSKTLARAGETITAMARSGYTRADHVVAVGGGVVGDLAGFCAHTYQRGVPVVQVPTTVVGQVDSAYGGKTGVDLPEAKNYVGAYQMPAAVIADTSLLGSLPAAELAAGFVEALKTGLLAGGRLWDAVREVEPGSATELARHPFLIFDCARFKCAVVAADERDGGLRQILNLGHTVGHAIEAAAGYHAFRHGEAVGLGLLAALRLSGAAELRTELAEILGRWRLPVSLTADRAPGLAPEAIEAALRRDKKRLGEAVPFVLLERPGEPRYGETVGREALRAAIEELYEKAS